MENENTQINDPVNEVSGSIAYPMTQTRMQAVAKAAKPKGIKAIHIVTTTETIKVATAFGATNKEITVEKTIEKTLVGEQEKVTVATEEEMDAKLREKLIGWGTPEDQIDGKIAEAKKVRETLKGLWAINGLNSENEAYEGESKERIANRQETSEKYIDADHYIEGMASDNGATIKPDTGNSAVRMKFTSKPRE